ncbi:MAG: D-glycero-beta-D-manno-heptose 1,7-bisphosphate 7-phosphatase [Desulfobacterales bacterium]|nr:D-glycero-beta-D-manno-heptose 1,7-bisphosphate 7-phosphatase [Desulfobacterales bacterium]
MESCTVCVSAWQTLINRPWITKPPCARKGFPEHLPLPNKIEPGSPEKYIFLDRDGVINRDSDAYVKNWAEFEFLPGSLTALEKLTLAGYRIIIITNQSIIGRKWVPLETLEDIFTRLRTEVEKNGGRIHDIFFCPHTPEDGCSCRKPAAGLIEKAARAYGINVSATTLVGDSAKDILCARKAGCKQAVLVKTGNYPAAQKILQKENTAPDAVFADLLEAVDWVLGSGE